MTCHLLRCQSLKKILPLRFALAWMALISFFGAAGLSSAWATPHAEIENEVESILDHVSDGTANDAAGEFQLRALMAQNPQDRATTIEALLQSARIFLRVPVPPNVDRAVAAITMLNKLNYHWVGREALDIHLSAVKNRRPGNRILELPWRTIIEMSNEDPRLIPVIAHELSSMGVDRGLDFSNALNFSSMENMQRYWVSYLEVIRFQLMYTQLTKRFGNIVPWVRAAVIRGLSNATSAEQRYFLEDLAVRTDGEPLHPELEAVILNFPIIDVEWANLSPKIRGRYLVQLHQSPLMNAKAEKINFDVSNGVEDLRLENIFTIMIPELEALGYRRDVANLAIAAMNYVRRKNRDVPFAVSDYFLRSYASAVNEGHPQFPAHAAVHFPNVELSIFQSPPGQGIERPEVQLAYIREYPNRSLFGKDSYIAYIGNQIHNLPAHAFTPELTDFFLNQLNTRTAGQVDEADVHILRKLARANPRVRNEVLAMMGLPENVSKRPLYAGILQDFYKQIPEVREFFDRRGLIFSELDPWIRQHGPLTGTLFTTTFKNAEFTERTARPTMLLDGPTPERKSMGRDEIFELNWTAVRTRPSLIPTTQQETALNSLHDDGSGLTVPTTQPGFPTVVGLYGNTPGSGKTKLYSLINEGDSDTSIDRIVRARAGHQERHYDISKFIDANEAHFRLLPLPKLSENFVALRRRLQKNQPVSGSRTTLDERQLPPLRPGERMLIEAQARAEILAVIAREHPPRRIEFPERSTAPYGQAQRVLPDHITFEPRLQLRGIAAHMPEHIDRRDVVIGPEQYLDKPPYAQQYHRMVEHLVQEARRKKVQSQRLSPQHELDLWRARESDELRRNFRRTLATVIREGHGVLVYRAPEEVQVWPPGFEPNHHFGIRPVHKLNVSDLERLEIEWDPFANGPQLKISGQIVDAKSLEYLPHLPTGVPPDAVSAYIMTEPEARGPQGQVLSETDLIRETLFRRGVPLILRNYGQATQVLAANNPEEIQFQINHFNWRDSGLDWVAPSQPAHTTVLEALLWHVGMKTLRSRELMRRESGQPPLNIAKSYMAEIVNQPPVQGRADKSARTPQQVLNDKTLPPNATNNIPTEDVLHFVDYQGRIPRTLLPEHFTLGEREEFHNLSETNSVEIPLPPQENIWRRLTRWRRPGQIVVRSRESYAGGSSATDALLPRPQDWDLAHLEVLDLQRNQLRPGLDYVVLRHGPSGDYAVRLTTKRMDRIPQFHVNATYRPSLQSSIRETATSYEIERLNPIVERLRDAGFHLLAQNVSSALQAQLQKNQVSISGRELEAVVKNSALYSYRPENELPGPASVSQLNEFSPWARFLGEEGIMCAQCDGTNGLFTTLLQSYHGAEPTIRVQRRSEFHVAPRARQLETFELHARVHEQFLNSVGRAIRVIYDVVPGRRDPRSVQPDLNLGVQARRKMIALRSRLVTFWQGMSRTLNAALQIINQRNQNSEQRTPAQARDLVPPFPALPPLRDYIENGIIEPESPATTVSPPTPIRSVNREPHFLGLTPEIISERSAALVRELAQSRRAIENLGGIGRLDRREPLVLADRLARTYQALLANEISARDAVTRLQEIQPELALQPNVTPAELTSAFIDAAENITNRARPNERLRNSDYSHYNNDARGNALRQTIQNLLQPIGLQSQTSVTPNTTECITKSLSSMNE